jgi:HSP20 family protein
MTPDRSSEDQSPQNRQQAGTQGSTQSSGQMGGSARGGGQQSGDMSSRRAQQSGGGASGQQGSARDYTNESVARGRDWRREDTYGSGTDDRDRGFPSYGVGLFSSMRRLSDEMDRVFDSFLGGRSRASAAAVAQPGSSSPSFWSPHIEMYERNGKVIITADLPGLKRDDVNIELHPDHIVLQGSRQQDQTTNERGYYRSERSYGSFYRSIPLPEGADGDSARATFEDGVLRIELKAPEQRQPRRLQIDEGSTRAADVKGSPAGGPESGGGGIGMP